MTVQRIFMTGASGCVGHYLTQALIQETPHELFLLLRDPDKLRVDCHVRPGITILRGGLQDIGRFRDLLKTVDVAILAAVAWGGTQETFDINVSKTIRLLEMLDPRVCQRVFYFSTASILDRHGHLLKEAAHVGTDYIRTKSVCYQQLSRLAIAPHLTVLFPTLVFGGNDHLPMSHLTKGLPEVMGRLGLMRFLGAEGSFHFIHARDIAQVVVHLLKATPVPSPRLQQMVLGNPALTVNQAIDQCCAYFGKRIYFRIPLTRWLTELLILVFGIQVAAWDRFCLRYRHFTYPHPVSPATLGLESYCPTLTDLLRISGLSPRTK